MSDWWVWPMLGCWVIIGVLLFLVVRQCRKDYEAADAGSDVGGVDRDRGVGDVDGVDLVVDSSDEAVEVSAHTTVRINGYCYRCSCGLAGSQRWADRHEFGRLP